MTYVLAIALILSELLGIFSKDYKSVFHLIKAAIKAPKAVLAKIKYGIKKSEKEVKEEIADKMKASADKSEAALHRHYRTEGEKAAYDKKKKLN